MFEDQLITLAPKNTFCTFNSSILILPGGQKLYVHYFKNKSDDFNFGQKMFPKII